MYINGHDVNDYVNASHDGLTKKRMESTTPEKLWTPNKKSTPLKTYYGAVV